MGKSVKIFIVLISIILQLSTITTVFGDDFLSNGNDFYSATGLDVEDLLPVAILKPQEINPVLGGFIANPSPEDATKSTSGVSDVMGTCSINIYPQWNYPNLSDCHKDANGFRTYLENWYTANFIRRDGNVGVWLYNDIAGGDNYDKWTSGGTDYGLDGVLCFWHSGHGHDPSATSYELPVGYNWAGRGTLTWSTNMALGGNASSHGDERCRYVFWATCVAVRTTGGRDPMTLWGPRAKGVRIIFGFDTTIIDSTNYGSYFWQEWNKSKSLSTAWMDASWRISTNQRPAVVAFGSTQSEAINRRDNERYLSWGSVSSAWGAWRWYSKSRTSTKSIKEQYSYFFNVSEPVVYTLLEKDSSDDNVLKAANNVGINLVDTDLIESLPFNLKKVSTSKANLFVDSNGNIELIVKDSESTSMTTMENAIPDSVLISRAQQIAKSMDTMNGIKFATGSVRYDMMTSSDTEYEDQDYCLRKTVVLDQVINGMTFVDPENGHLEITFDSATGNMTGLKSTVVDYRKQGLKRRQKGLAAAKKEALGAFEKNQDPGYLLTASYGIDKDTAAIGYQVINGKIVPVLRVEVRDTGTDGQLSQLSVISLVE